VQCRDELREPGIVDWRQAPSKCAEIDMLAALLL
jgi:hypothetical protein